jgi:hypothetical protein
MPGPCSQTDDGDGTVRYDRLADRWVVSQFSLANYDGLTNPDTNAVYTQDFQCVAISKTDDPTGAYWLYAFAYNGFNDYPKFGVWPDAYYVTYNMFDLAGNTFTGVKTCALDRSAMLAGTAATQQCFDLPNAFSILPANLEGPAAPPAGAPNYQLALDNRFGSSTLDAWTLHVDWTTPANTSWTALSKIAVDSYAGACANSGTYFNCIPQPTAPYYSTGTLDSLGDRLMWPLQYRNFGDHQSLVVSHSVQVNGAGAGERWYEIRVGASNGLALVQQGTYAPDDGLYRFMGSIAQDGVGDMALGYSVSSPSVYPGIRFTGRLAGDAAGTMTETEHTIQDGLGSEGSSLSVSSPAVGRWGDYTTMDIDPADDCTFWYTNEYYPAQTDSTDTHFYRRWHTVIASMRFPACSDDFSIAATPASRTVNTTTTTTVHTAATRGAGQSVSFTVSGCPSGATCGFSKTSAVTGTDSTLTITPGSAADGSYQLSITGTGAKAGVHSAPFTVNLDRTKPTARLTSPTAAFVLATSTRVAWTGADSGSGIAAFDVQRRVAAYSGGFGSWAGYVTEPATTRSMTVKHLLKGYTYCYRVRAVDVAHNAGNWSAQRCTAVPLDDRALAAASTWTRANGKSYWNGTVTKATKVHSALTRTGARLDRVAVVAMRCSTCGVVGVYVGSTLIGKINTSGPAQYRRVYVLPAFRYRTGSVVVKVLSRGKVVQVDGLAITRV